MQTEKIKVFYIIVYLKQDSQKLHVVMANNYEIKEFVLASRKKFSNEKEAIEYAKKLALKHNKYFENRENFKILD